MEFSKDEVEFLLWDILREEIRFGEISNYKKYKLKTLESVLLKFIKEWHRYDISDDLAILGLFDNMLLPVLKNAKIKPSKEWDEFHKPEIIDNILKITSHAVEEGIKQRDKKTKGKKIDYVFK
jgi:hypothetical protein